MNTILRILIKLVVQASLVVFQSGTMHTVTVNITGLDSSDGKLLVGLYDSEEHFLDKRFKSAIGEISEATGQVVFKDIPDGIYAISFIHDENDNGKMDTNFLGIPKEDYGCSNNAKGFMGPPKWEDAKFELKDNKIVNIQL
ncbi:MAG: DUF2141 domain-containing protein [Winogradskyella sp.]|uniref:DUF2141 domain-containing protein n=1 Tax=Winogradskyella sp. TaxID=1883156 RepID=UPI000F3B54FF|nr:DUF2141 domain-containing protein [Winogradskyella sp.]RNC86915.1 MAG: DUF2141 domain-containing protein [Winogradskyella sp.]